MCFRVTFILWILFCGSLAVPPCVSSMSLCPKPSRNLNVFKTQLHASSPAHITPVCHHLRWLPVKQRTLTHTYVKQLLVLRKALYQFQVHLFTVCTSLSQTLSSIVAFRWKPHMSNGYICIIFKAF